MDIKVDSNTVIVFDLDDTLYNELDYLISAYKSIATELDPLNSKKLFSVIFSMYRNNQDVFSYLSNIYSIEKSLLLTMYRNHFPRIKLDVRIKELLQLIKNNSGKLAVLTDGRSITQKNKLKSLEMLETFDYISISEEIDAIKPSLKGFQLIENYFKATNYYYIGDNISKDFIAPNKLGWQTICLVDSGKNIHHSSQYNLEKEKKPDYYIYSLVEIQIV
jgi:putative hydrolase of the HAD superfamily